MIRVFGIVALTLSFAFSSGAVLAAKSGYWVIVGSYPTEPPERQVQDFRRVRAAAARCHVKTYNDFASKFGFTPRSDLNVFVLSGNGHVSSGLFATIEAAQRKAKSVRRCFPDAYIKWGNVPGE
ncbi:MAG TPA: hypothetical protein VFF88_09080 [Methylocella sp.]|nr:hypothetical protein [Methylocella sp.]